MLEKKEAHTSEHEKVPNPERRKGVGGSRAVTSQAVTCSRTEPHLQNDATACCVQHLPHKIEAAAHNHAESSCQYQLQDFSLIELYSKFTLFTDSKNHDLYCPWID